VVGYLAYVGFHCQVGIAVQKIQEQGLCVIVDACNPPVLVQLRAASGAVRVMIAESPCAAYGTFRVELRGGVACIASVAWSGISPMSVSIARSGLPFRKSRSRAFA